MAKPIVGFDELNKYFMNESTLQELMQASEPYIRQVEIIAQRMRANKISNSLEYQQARNELAGIYTTLNKISKATYAHANHVKNKVLVSDLDDYLKNPWTAEEKKENKDGEVKVNKKVIPFSSTISKAKAERDSHIYFRVANYIKSYVDSIEQMSMALSAQSKLQSRFGNQAENRVEDIDGDDNELE